MFPGPGLEKQPRRWLRGIERTLSFRAASVTSVQVGRGFEAVPMTRVANDVSLREGMRGRAGNTKAPAGAGPNSLPKSKSLASRKLVFRH